MFHDFETSNKITVICEAVPCRCIQVWCLLEAPWLYGGMVSQNGPLVPYHLLVQTGSNDVVFIRWIKLKRHVFEVFVSVYFCWQKNPGGAKQSDIVLLFWGAREAKGFAMKKQTSNSVASDLHALADSVPPQQPRKNNMCMFVIWRVYEPSLSLCISLLGGCT